jgi:hypothetical protein
MCAARWRQLWRRGGCGGAARTRQLEVANEGGAQALRAAPGARRRVSHSMQPPPSS